MLIYPESGLDFCALIRAQVYLPFLAKKEASSPSYRSFQTTFAGIPQVMEHVPERLCMDTAKGQ